MRTLTTLVTPPASEAGAGEGAAGGPMAESVAVPMAGRTHAEQMAWLSESWDGKAADSLIARLVEACRSHPDDQPLRLTLIEGLVRAGRHGDALVETDGLDRFDATGFLRLANRAGVEEVRGDLSTAARTLAQALEIRPDWPDLWERLLSLADRGGVAAEQGLAWAAAARRAAVDEKKRLALALAESGWMIRARRYPAAMVQAALVARTAALRPDLRAGPDTRPRADDATHQARCRAVLADAVGVLDEAGIIAFPVAGTLLGWWRDGRFLPGDKDIDLVLPPGQDPDAAREALTGSGRFHMLPDPIGLRDGFSVRHTAIRLMMDLVAHRDRGDHVEGGSRMDGLADEHCRLLRHAPYRLVRDAWLGIPLWRPEAPEVLLAEYYGPDWRRPDPDFDSLVFAPCIKGFPDQVRALAYHRMAETLLAGRLRRAAAYVRGLLARDAGDPLAGWLAAEPPLAGQG